jgi:hypothetical protein
MPPNDTRYVGTYTGTVTDSPDPDSKIPGSIKVDIGRIGIVNARQSFPRGVHARPQKDDQVWVAFGDGLLANAYYTGVWYPVDKAPATDEHEQPTKDHFVFSSPAGHVLCLDDTKNAERVVLQNLNDRALSMTKDGIELKCGTSTISIKDEEIELVCGGSKITVGKAGIKLEAAGHHFDMAASGTTLNGQYVVLEPFLTWVNGGLAVLVPPSPKAIPVSPDSLALLAGILNKTSQMPG